MRGREHLDEAAGTRPVDVAGHGKGVPLVRERELRLAAAADEGHHAVALREAEHAGPGRGDLARELEPGDVGRGVRRRRVAAGPLDQVGPVQACGADTHEELAVSRNGIRPLLDANRPGCDDRGAHLSEILER